jgi:hypothetical protein
VTSHRRVKAAEPVLSLKNCWWPRVQAGLLTGGSRATMRSLRSPAFPRNGLLAIFFPWASPIPRATTRSLGPPSSAALRA